MQYKVGYELYIISEVKFSLQIMNFAVFNNFEILMSGWILGWLSGWISEWMSGWMPGYLHTSKKAKRHAKEMLPVEPAWVHCWEISWWSTTRFKGIRLGKAIHKIYKLPYSAAVEVNMLCKCLLKSKCATVRCSCKAIEKRCISDCGCNINICSNK